MKIAVVGGGIGGVCAAAWLTKQQHDVTLYEKEPVLGGSCATFVRGLEVYNAAATTFAGYGHNALVQRFFDEIGLDLSDLYEPTPFATYTPQGMLLCQGDKQSFLAQLDHLWPSTQHAPFWNLIWETAEKFYCHDRYYLSSHDWLNRCFSLGSFIPLGCELGWAIIQKATDVAKRYYQNFDPAYRQFLDAQVRIVAQTSFADVSFLTAALALAYPMGAHGHIRGGMGSVFERIRPMITTVRCQTAVTKLRTHDNHFCLSSQHGEELFEGVVWGAGLQMLQSCCDDARLKRYLSHYPTKTADQSAFVVYLSLASTSLPTMQAPSGQILLSQPYALTMSDAVFVSVCKTPTSTTLTISIHTRPSWWRQMDETTYKNAKKRLQQAIVDDVCATLSLPKEAIIKLFSATPRTFERYIGRSDVGGFPLSYHRLLTDMIPNDTPIKGLYLVGEEVFAGQGWPGVIMGVRNFTKVFRVRE